MGTNKQGETAFMTFIDSGICHFHVLFSVGLTYDEIVKQLRLTEEGKGWADAIKDSENIVNNPYGGALRRTENGKTYFYLILPDFDYSEAAYITLAHEALHIVQFALEEITANREWEFEAYMHSYIMKKCLEAIETAEAILKESKQEAGNED